MKHFLILLLIFSVSFSFSHLAHAKGKRPARAYSYFDDDGKATQGVCDGESKIPRKLQRQKEFSKSKDYLGSEKLKSELQANVVSWKHYFRTSATCNSYLFKVQVPR